MTMATTEDFKSEFCWSSCPYTMSELLHSRFKMPMLGKVTGGIYGPTDDDTYSEGQLLLLHSVEEMELMLACNDNGDIITIPLNHEHELEIYHDKQCEKYIGTYTLRQILSKHRPPVRAKFAPQRTASFYIKGQLKNSEDFGNMTLKSLKYRKYFKCSPITDDGIIQTDFLYYISDRHAIQLFIAKKANDSLNKTLDGVIAEFSEKSQRLVEDSKQQRVHWGISELRSEMECDYETLKLYPTWKRKPRKEKLPIPFTVDHSVRVKTCVVHPATRPALDITTLNTARDNLKNTLINGTLSDYLDAGRASSRSYVPVVEPASTTSSGRDSNDCNEYHNMCPAGAPYVNAKRKPLIPVTEGDPKAEPEGIARDISGPTYHDAQSSATAPSPSTRDSPPVFTCRDHSLPKEKQNPSTSVVKEAKAKGPVVLPKHTLAKTQNKSRELVSSSVLPQCRTSTTPSVRGGTDALSRAATPGLPAGWASTAANAKRTTKYNTIYEIPKDISSFGVLAIADCLSCLNLPEMIDRFRQDNIDGKLLQTLKAEDLVEEYGMTTVAAKKLEMFARRGWRPKMN